MFVSKAYLTKFLKRAKSERPFVPITDAIALVSLLFQSWGFHFWMPGICTNNEHRGKRELTDETVTKNTIHLDI